jgi:hypothetical protein
MNNSPTVFASLADYSKGGVETIDGNPKHYAFSNVFEVASRSAPYERVAVARNLNYVLEAVRAEGVSPWFAAAHDEAVLVMDGQVLVEFIRPGLPVVAPESVGARALEQAPQGTRMGWVRAGRGHMTLLPAGSAYRFTAEGRPGALLIQTIAGPLTIERWQDICQVA